jgi:hypothetical protein
MEEPAAAAGLLMGGLLTIVVRVKLARVAEVEVVVVALQVVVDR